MQQAHDDIVVSAPGKVLIAGGYLVLEPAYPGLVISTTARFYTVVRRRSSTSRTARPTVRIHSPQFVGALWEYTVSFDNQHCTVEQSKETYEAEHAGQNPFVGLAVLYAVRLAFEATSAEAIEGSLRPNGIDVFIVADNDFYSQRAADGKAPSSSELKAAAPFKPQGCPIRQVHKTGLGSSAAMTTSLVAALLLHFGVVHSDSTTGGLAGGSEALALLHNTAQLAHCAAQGKVGSGFDVSAAVWGSQLYRRFDKMAIQAVLDAGDKVNVEGVQSNVDRASTASQKIELSPFLDPRNPLWHPSPLTDVQKGESNPTAVEGLAYSSSSSISTIARPAPLELPPHLQLALADVDSGSNTPSMVGKILAWRKEKPEWAKQMWTILSSGNQTLADALLALRLCHAQDSAAYDAALRLASKHFSREWDVLSKTHPSAAMSLLLQVRNAMRAVQGGMRELGRQAGVPVEPNEMGDVIRATIDGAHGVIGGGVPGAGGFDALFVLFIEQPTTSQQPERVEQTDLSVEQEIEGVWSHWTKLSIGPLLSRAGGSSGVSTVLDQTTAALLAQGAPSPISVLPSEKHSLGGLRVHALDDVVGLGHALSMSS